RTNDEDYRAYREVNRRMAVALRSLAQARSQIWVHDYHFLTLAEELRHLNIVWPIGFFLHTPFPPRTVFTSMPHHCELVEALLHSDLLGFQTEDDKANFADYLEHEFGMELAPDGTVSGISTRLGSFPIGIDVQAFAEGALRAAARPEIAR